MTKSTKWMLVILVAASAFTLGTLLGRQAEPSRVAGHVDATAHWDHSGTNVFLEASKLKVGIGTTNPGGVNGVPFDVVDVDIRSGSASGMALQGITQADFIFNTSGEAVNSRIFQISDSAGTLKFRSLNDAGTVKNDLLALNTNGKVGFGIVNIGLLNGVPYDAADFHFYGGASAGFAVDGINQADILFNTSGEPLNSRIFQLTDSAGSLKFRSLNDAGTLKNEILSMTTGGNVGVRTTTPTEALEVQGNIKINGNIKSTGEICIGSGC